MGQLRTAVTRGFVAVAQTLSQFLNPEKLIGFRSAVKSSDLAGVGELRIWAEFPRRQIPHAEPSLSLRIY